MIKRALQNAIGPSVGVVIGSLTFRIANSHLYDETWPSLFTQTALYLFVGYIACFLVILAIEWIKSKIRSDK